MHGTTEATEATEELRFPEHYRPLAFPQAFGVLTVSGTANTGITLTSVFPPWPSVALRGSWPLTLPVPSNNRAPHSLSMPGLPCVSRHVLAVSTGASGRVTKGTIRYSARHVSGATVQVT